MAHPEGIEGFVMVLYCRWKWENTFHPVRSILASAVDPGRTKEAKSSRPLHRGNNLDGIRIFVFTPDSNVYFIRETLETHSPSVYILQNRIRERGDFIWRLYIPKWQLQNLWVSAKRAYEKLRQNSALINKTTSMWFPHRSLTLFMWDRSRVFHKLEEIGNIGISGFAT